MEIRAARFADIPQLRELMVAAMDSLGPVFYPVDLVDAAARYLTVPDMGLIEDGTLYVCLDRRPQTGNEPRMVGVGGWSRRRKLFTGSDDQEALTGRLDPATEPARIRAFFVHPEYARRGIARALYAACEEAARDAGFRTLTLMATLPGVPLYRSLGFGEERQTRIALPDGSRLECVEMSKTIP